MLEPRVKELEPRVKGLSTRRANRTGRDADPRRAIPLNSAAWQRLRSLVLAEEPLCRECSKRGQIVPATDVDHHDGNPGNNELENLVPLCHACHSRKTAADHGKRVRHGCDANGMPLDPHHPWNRPA
ncbi:HNH endonuclease [Burkholderia thailandensis]|uniref:HNH endonuclease n=1 Tax=Burkholderia thailandensis TaxID=57975 RepID=UPI000CB49BFE|nr:HNH endonuclease signature motif containing protein [Burkholderia thailandensis]MCS6490770.1 HNH endonuclease [Burkholderia thailandensis]MCS6518146.1 HNH endonuclease [Burkholderia thailandensis]PJO72421.1 HNH endonuclease [Burkholderia thailandensis]